MAVKRGCLPQIEYSMPVFCHELDDVEEPSNIPEDLGDDFFPVAWMVGGWM